MKRLIPRRGALVFAIVLAGSLTGCDALDPEPEKTLNELTRSYNDLADKLEAVQDPGSAQAATAGVKADFARIIRALERLPDLMQKYKDKKVSKTKLDKMNRDRQEGEQRLKREMERIDRIRGLPAEFWSAMQKGGIDILVAAVKFLQALQGPMPEEAANYAYNAQRLLNEHGHGKVVAVEMKNLPSSFAQQAYDRIGDAAPGATLYHFSQGSNHDVMIGPVEDFQTILNAVDFGTVVYEDEGRRALVVEVDRRKLGARANTDQEERQLSQEDIQRQREESRKRDEERRKRDEERRKRMEAERIAREKEWRAPDPNDPDYYEQLVDHLQDERSRHRDKAISTLLATQPEEVESAETRKQIARAFKDLAFNNGFKQKEGIRGMVVWGGQYSVPLLLDLLAQNLPHIRGEIYTALGDLQDARAAGPVAARLGNFFDGNEATKCLRRLGPLAEDALMEVAPSNDPKICLAALELLGEVGTEKSVKLLREGMRSRNPQVKAAAKMSLQRVLDRQKKAEKE